ncbi:MAG: cation-translocating P-type ATPase [Candidatus Zipacnadales bacterium]
MTTLTPVQLPPRGDIITALPSRVYDLLETSPQGLSEEEARRRFEEFGPNIVARSQPYPVWRIALDQFASPVIYVLLVAALITVLLRDYKDSAIIMAVVIINAAIGFFQEFKATRAIEALRKLATPLAAVRRSGVVKQVSSDQLVPGDVVIVEAGMRAAADMRIVRAVEILADESQLTGESLPVEKTPQPLPDPDTLLADTTNMLFAGSMILEGRGEAVVAATGDRSELGKIAQAVAEVKPTHTPLQRRLHVFATTLAYGIVLLALITIGIGLARGMSLLEVFLAAVALAVSVMPEGLPIVVTVVLSIGVQRMAARNVLVRKLPAAETMGSVDIICTDKTGTLTQNHMTVRTLVWGPYHAEVHPEAPLLSCPDVQLSEDTNCPLDEPQVLQSLHQLLRIAVFCNNAEYAHTEANKVTTSGSPTEVALLEAAAVLAPELLHQRDALPPISEVPFSSERKFMATVQSHEGGELVLYAKGAPEVIIHRCRSEWSPETDEAKPLDKDRWGRLVEQMAYRGERVVALAQRPWSRPAVQADEIADLMLCGLIGISDPPRPEAVEALSNCRESGIKVIMVTGDHPVTAAAISRQVKLVSDTTSLTAGPDSCVINGAQLARMSEAELKARLPQVCAFARVTPHDKLRVVETLQQQGHVVAVTGDGINDAPALRRAEIGVAMGKGGTEAAREAADVVLLDDSFASIYEAVKLGRHIFENIRKVVFFLISSGVGEVIAIVGSLVMGWPLPFSAAQILWINLVTNGLQDVALAFEPGEEFVSRRPPHGLRARILDRIVITYTAIVGVLFGMGSLAVFHYVLLDSEKNEALARTAAVTTMVMFQLFHALSCRSLVTSVLRIPPLSNPLVVGSLFIAVGAQLLFIYWPSMQRLFDTEPLPPLCWAYILMLSLLGVVIMELAKIIVRHNKWHLN